MLLENLIGSPGLMLENKDQIVRLQSGNLSTKDSTKKFAYSGRVIKLRVAKKKQESSLFPVCSTHILKDRMLARKFELNH